MPKTRAGTSRGGGMVLGIAAGLMAAWARGSVGRMMVWWLFCFVEWFNKLAAIRSMIDGGPSDFCR